LFYFFIYIAGTLKKGVFARMITKRKAYNVQCEHYLTLSLRDFIIAKAQ